MSEPSRLRQIVESTGVTLGVVLSIIAVWNSFRPGSRLVGEITTVTARLAPQTVTGLEGIPDRLAAEIARSDDEATKHLSAALTAADTQELQRLVLKQVQSSIYSPLLSYNDLAVVKVANRGTETLKGVWLSIRSGQKRQLRLYLPNQLPHLVEVEGRIDFGELRPGEEASAEIWETIGLFQFPFGILLSHDGGVGELRYPVFVRSQYEWGYWISWQQMLVVGSVAGVLLVLGGLWVWHWRVRPSGGLPTKQGTPQGNP